MDGRDLAAAVLTVVSVALISTGVGLIAPAGYAIIAAGVLLLAATCAFVRLTMAAAATEAVEEATLYDVAADEQAAA